MRLFVDTNIFLSILNEEENYHAAKMVLENIHKGKHVGFTSVICIAEILSGFQSSREIEKGEKFLIDIMSINNFTIIDVDISIAKEASTIRAKYKVRLPDAIIVSTCKVRRCALVTRDEEFKRITEIEVKSPEEVC
ncbi:MAG: PIN domain-containing protein [Methanosarcinales archaeon Met12]|nr:MAG: PIN domain-containing protein [Methanosarcinales archaeon Met12]